jgi:hypothetical protein
MIAMTQRKLNEAEATLSSALQSGAGNAGLVGAFAAEHMRALIYGCAVANGRLGSIRTIHTTRLLASARRAVDLVWPEYAHRAAVPDVCSATLERMETIGDAVNTGEGQWLAAPLRIVMPGDGDRYLLLGAAPLEAVYRRLGVAPACAGATRFVGPSVFEATGSDDFAISTDTWLGEVHALAAWTALILASHEARMEAIEGLSAEYLEVYAPDVAQAQHRSGRWLPASQIGRSLDGVRLCRPQERYAQSWDRPSYLSHFDFRNGALTLRRAASITPDLTLRLCFGLDVQLQTPRRLSITRQHEVFSVERPLTLPRPERRVYALGWRKAAPQTASEKLIFHVDALPFVMRALQRLSITPSIVHRSPS